jgi:putative ABC transport system substrate-binding protein
MLDVRRRDFIALLGGGMAAWPLAARAQQTQRVRKIGVLMPLGESDPEARRRLAVFSQALREAGWAEGQTVTFETRYADGKPERLPALAVELVQTNVAVIVTQAAQSVEAARKATSTVPIVMASVGDALGAGYIASLARPGGNITGLTLVATEQSAKRLQFIKELFPSLVRVGVLWNVDASGHRLQLKEMEQATPALGIELQSIPIRNTTEIDEGLRTAVQANVRVLVTMDDPLIQSQRARIVEFAMRRGLPVMGEFRPFTDAGALLSYGPNQVEMWRRAAAFVDKIFKGTKPADLPVEQPTKFELVINMKTAKALGLEIPPTLLALADEVIE